MELHAFYLLALAITAIVLIQPLLHVPPVTIHVGALVIGRPMLIPGFRTQ